MKPIIMPPYTFDGPRYKLPHRRNVVARTTIGSKVEVSLVSNHGETQWWLVARYSGGGYFAQPSNGLTTRSAAKAAQWLEAVEAGNVQIEDSE